MSASSAYAAVHDACAAFRDETITGDELIPAHDFSEMAVDPIMCPDDDT